MSDNGEILGKNKYTYARKTSNKDIIWKARNVRNTLMGKIPNCPKIKTRAELLLRNALVRSTMTYGLQTHGISERDKTLLGGFAFACVRKYRTASGTKRRISRKDTKRITIYPTQQPNRE